MSGTATFAAAIRNSRRRLAGLRCQLCADRQAVGLIGTRRILRGAAALAHGDPASDHHVMEAQTRRQQTHLSFAEICTSQAKRVSVGPKHTSLVSLLSPHTQSLLHKPKHIDRNNKSTPPEKTEQQTWKSPSPGSLMLETNITYTHPPPGGSPSRKVTLT